MTTEKTEKQKPAFYIFTKDREGNTTNAGAAFKKAKGTGYDIVIGTSRYVAYPPKIKPDNC